MSQKAPSPELRCSHLSAIVERRMLVWGGRKERNGSYFPNDVIWALNLNDHSWSKRISAFKIAEDVPRPCHGSRMAVVGNRRIYQFGGSYCPVLQQSFSSDTFFNALHQLDGLTLDWERVRPKGRAPEERSACGLCLLGDQLVLMGGIGGRSSEGTFYNDVWYFSLDERIWSEVKCKGRTPRPRSGHSFTAIDENTAVLYGGVSDQENFADIFVFKFRNKEWVEISSEFGPNRLTPCLFHSAVYVPIPKKGPHLFIFWGSNKPFAKPLSKATIIDLIKMQYLEVGIFDLLPRRNQTVCFDLETKGKIRFLRFGGLFEMDEPKHPLEILEWDHKRLSFLQFEAVNPVLAREEEQNNPTKKQLVDGKDEIERDDLEFDDEKDFISAGGYGEVYKAKMKQSGETVALKIVIRRRRYLSESALLKKEAEILLGVKPHPHIVKFIGTCSAPSFYALIMEYISGGDLARLLASSNPVVAKWENRLDISYQIALGMDHLHGNSPPVIHLDLKPSNVLIEKTDKKAAMSTRKFVCKICDFGFAKMKDVSSVTLDRPVGSLPAGTVAYLAPERYEAYGKGTKEEKTEVAKKSDVFSFGVVLWEIRERHCPFKGMTNEAIRLYIKSGDHLPTGSVSGLDTYDQLVRDCSAFDPVQRPSFTDIVHRLESLVG